MRKIIVLALLIASLCSYSQLLMEKSQIIKEKGKNYTTDITESGMVYITYTKEMNTTASGKYIETKSYFFSTIGGKEICIMWVTVEPITEMNSNVRWLRKNLVEIGTLKFKDYETDVIYELKSHGDRCTVTAWYDLESY